MFLFGKKKHDKQLDALIQELQMNASNNYKDAAQKSLKELEEAFADSVDSGRLSDAGKAYYEPIIAHYRKQLVKFTHADQKASWD